MHTKKTVFEVTAHIGQRKKKEKKTQPLETSVCSLSKWARNLFSYLLEIAQSPLPPAADGPFLSVCLVFFFPSLFVVTDEACHAVSTEKPRRLLEALDLNIPIR